MDRAEIKQIKEIRRQKLSLTAALVKTATKRVSLALLAIVILLSAAISVLDSHITESKYQLGGAAQELSGKSAIDLKSTITRDQQTGDLVFKKDLQNPQPQGSVKENKIQNKEGQYSITIKNDPKEGISYYDPDSSQSFTIKPNFDVLTPRVVGEHVIIPTQNSATQQVLTFKGNGLKEDLILNVPQGDSREFSYSLDLPKSLEARLEQSGEIGIYTGTDQGLFGSQISYGSDKDKELVEKAQAKAKKDKLVFVLPAPVVAQAGGGDLLPETTAKFILKDNIVVVKAEGLAKLKYPISIDPSAIVNSASTFGTGKNEGNATISSSSGQISRTTMSGGAVASGASTPVGGFPVSATEIATFTYNGRIYTAGGCTVVNGSSYCTTAIDTVYMSTLNSDGTLTSWANTSSDNLPSAMYGAQATAYNGYVYLAGGLPTGSPPSTSATVYYSKIDSSTGHLSGWTATSSLNTARSNVAMVSLKGYVYVIGGCSSVATVSNCPVDVGLDDVEYAPIKADGSLGSWQATNLGVNLGCTILASTSCFFTKAFAYNGYIYFSSVGFNTLTTLYYSFSYTLSVDDSTGNVSSRGSVVPATLSGSASYKYLIGAYGGYVYSNSENYALDSDGGITQTTATSAGAPSGVFYKDYIYQIAGSGTSPANSSTYYTFNGSIGLISKNIETTNSLASGRQRFNPCAVAYSGYVYLIGGDEAGPVYTNNVLTAQLLAEGGVGGWTTQANTFTTGRSLHSCQVYNGYIYVIAGNDGTNDKDDIQYASVTGGTVNAFATATAKLPAARAGLGTAIYKNGNGNVYLYTIGGCTTSAAACSTGSTAHQQIYYGTVNTSTGNVCGDNTGSWDCASGAGSLNLRTATANTNNALYQAMYSFSSFVFKGKLYIVGGMTSATARVNTVEYIDISSTSGDGDISNFGSWAATTSMAANASGRALHNTTMWNGYIYVFGGTTGASATGTQISNGEYAQINSNGTVGSWTNFQSTPGTGWVRNGSVAYEGKMYVISGNRGGSRIRSALTFYINNGGFGGAMGATTADTSLANARYGQGSAAYNGYLYIAGGYKCDDASSPCGTTTTVNADVLKAPINPSGALGSWTTETSLSSVRHLAKLVISNNTAYIIGGCTTNTCGTRLNTVEMATVNPSNGSIGSWSATSSFTTARGGFGTLQYNGYLYIIGGCGATFSAGNCPTPLSDTQYAQINSNGTLGSWTATTSLATARWSNFALTYNGYVYSGGGMDTSAPLYDLNYATLNSNGTIGSWTQDYYLIDRTGIATAFPAVQAFADNGFLYVTYNSGEVLAAPIGNSGGLNGPWNTSSNFVAGGATGAYGTTTYYKGNVYFVGGALIFSVYNNAAHAQLYNSPRVATYSKLIDTDVDTTPIKTLFSGTNVGNPGRPGTEGKGGVTLRYKSLTEGGTVGISSLLNPGFSSIFGNLFNYTAYDASGVDRGVARSYLFIFTLDESQTVTFPESGGNASTITGYTLWYHPGSVKRLRGGSTFTGESLQSLDAPPN